MAISPISPQSQHAMLPTSSATDTKPTVSRETQNPVSDDANLPDIDTVRQATATLNHLAQTVHTGVSFEIDDSTGKTVIKVMDTEHNTLIRQLPSEEALALSHAIDVQQGLLLKTKS